MNNNLSKSNKILYIILIFIAIAALIFFISRLLPEPDEFRDGEPADITETPESEIEDFDV